MSEVPTEVGQLVLEKVQAGGLQSLNSDEFVDEVIETAAAAALVGESIGVTTGALGLDRSRYEAGIDEDARLARMSEEERNLLDAEIEEDMLDEDAVDTASQKEIDAERERQRAEEKEQKAAAKITDEQLAEVTGGKEVIQLQKAEKDLKEKLREQTLKKWEKVIRKKLRKKAKKR